MSQSILNFYGRSNPREQDWLHLAWKAAIRMKTEQINYLSDGRRKHPWGKIKQIIARKGEVTTGDLATILGISDDKDEKNLGRFLENQFQNGHLIKLVINSGCNKVKIWKMPVQEDAQ